MIGIPSKDFPHVAQIKRRQLSAAKSQIGNEWISEILMVEYGRVDLRDDPCIDSGTEPPHFKGHGKSITIVLYFGIILTHPMLSLLLSELLLDVFQ
jgi:hypothetical protein